MGLLAYFLSEPEDCALFLVRLDSILGQYTDVVLVVEVVVVLVVVEVVVDVVVVLVFVDFIGRVGVGA